VLLIATLGTLDPPLFIQNVYQLHPAGMAIPHNITASRGLLSWNANGEGFRVSSSYYGIAEMFLSFATNVWATTLIGLKTWYASHTMNRSPC
jgi:hypothetical protein